MPCNAAISREIEVNRSCLAIARFVCAISVCHAVAPTKNANPRFKKNFISLKTDTKARGASAKTACKHRIKRLMGAWRKHLVRECRISTRDTSAPKSAQFAILEIL